MSQTAGGVRVQVPAKVNLQLAVGPLRTDGFHELATVFCSVDLCDVLSATPAGSLTLRLTGPESAGLAADQTNLAWRAAELLAEHAGVEPRAALHVEKNIPVAAGLAGGSADAAAALLACDRLWQLNLPASDLAALAAELGSDVAFALLGGTAVGTGRGERLTPVEAAGFHWVLAVADGGLATPAVYAELDRRRGPGARTAADPAAALEDSGVLAAVTGGDPRVLAGRLGNDLQPAALALAPQLADTLAAGLECGALAGIVSGSGPTCAFLAADAEHARTLAAALAGSCRRAVAVTGGTARPTVVPLDPAAFPPAAAVPGPNGS